MIDDAITAANQIFTPPFRAALWKTLALTLALLGLVWIVLHKLIVAGLSLSASWAVTSAHSWAYSWVVSGAVSWTAAALSLISGLGLVVGLAFLVTPVSFIVAGYFFDELAEAVETELAPGELPGRALALGDAIWLSVKFAAVSLAVNLAALLLLLIPGINAAAFFGANAYLFGRGYFELAAARYLPFAEVRRLRKAHTFRLFGAGLVMAALLAVPVLNLLTPLFGTAFMVRIAGKIMRQAGQTPHPARWAR